MDLGKYERKKIWRKNGRKEKVKEMNINFFTCLVIYEKFKRKRKKNSFFLFVNHEKMSRKNGRKTNQ